MILIVSLGYNVLYDTLIISIVRNVIKKKKSFILITS